MNSMSGQIKFNWNRSLINETLLQNFGNEGAEQNRVIVLRVLFCFLISVTVFANFLLILSIAFHKPLRTWPNYLLVSLAVADFCVGSIVMPIEAFFETVGPFWLFDSIFCRIWTVTSRTFVIASVFGTLVIAYYRYVAISQPFLFSPTSTATIRSRRQSVAKDGPRIVPVVAIVWFMSAALSMPLIYETDSFDNKSCGFIDVNYEFYSSLFSFLIPSIFIIVVNIAMLRIVRKIERQRELRRKCKKYSTSLVSVNRQNSTRCGFQTVNVLCKTMEKVAIGRSRSKKSENRENIELESISSRPRSHSFLANEIKKLGRPEALTVKRSSSSICESDYSGGSRIWNKLNNRKGSETENEITFARATKRKRNDSNFSDCSIGTFSSTVKRKSIANDLSRLLELYMGNTQDDGSKTNAAVPSVVVSRIRTKSKAIIRRKKSTILLVTILSLFFICRCPIFIAHVQNWLLSTFCKQGSNSLKCEQLHVIPKGLQTVFKWLALCNSTVNPFIYTAFNSGLTSFIKQSWFRRKKIISQ